MVFKFLKKKKAEEVEEKKPSSPGPFMDKKTLFSLRPVRNPMIEWEKTEDNNVVIYLTMEPSKIEKFIMGRAAKERVKRIVLDEVGSFVWELCDGNHTVGDIVEALAKKYKLRRLEAERSLIEFLRMLSQRMLVGFLPGAKEK